MAYTTEAQVRIESPFKDSALITSAYITETIGDADAIIDSYIGEVYQLPLGSTPDLIRSISKDLTICLLFFDQNTNLEIATGVDVTDRYKELIAMLEGIRDRKIKLFGASGSELPLNGNSLPKFYPTDSSSDPSTPDSTRPLLTINQIF